jgi:L-asparagine oxygenase
LLFRDVLSEVHDGPTPTVAYGDLGSPVLGTERYLLFLAGRVGTTVNFADWHGGEHIQNLYPIRDLHSVQCASNAVYLELHTETAFRPTTPLVVSLLCLRRDPAGRALTLLCDLRAVIETLDPEIQVTLAKPKFCFTRPDSPGRFTEPKPIASGHGRFSRINYAEGLTACDQLGLHALARLNNRIKETCLKLELFPGDLLLIDNTHMIHGRTSYSPCYDGRDRWLQRLLIGEVVSVRPEGEPLGIEVARG